MAAKVNRGKRTTVRKKSTTGSSGKKSSGAASRKKKKVTRTRKKKTVKNVKKGVRSLFELLMTVVSIFLVLFMLGLTFWLYQWKEHRIIDLNKEIQRLKVETQELKSDISRHRAKIGKELIVYDRIKTIARQKMSLKPSVSSKQYLDVDKQKFAYYARKDKEDKAQ